MLSVTDTKEIEKLSEICNKYDCFFIDLWGVVHNGVSLFKNVKETLNSLKKNKDVFFLTNAPRRSHVIKEQLLNFGIESYLYNDVISSGEITWQRLKEKKDLNCFLIGPPRDYHLIEGLNLNIVKDAKSVDMIINTGPWGDNDILDNYIPVLNQLIKFDPIMICSNPDKTVIRGEKFMICAGLLAEYYQKIGGKVEFYGKPHSEIYEFTYLKIKNKTSQILVIGDSLENDIKGANLQNLDSLLITSGIHREVNNDSGVDKEKLNDLIRKKKIWPKYYMKDFIF
jgi:HAD superfamily hydrolase (TIGR01459 family)